MKKRFLSIIISILMMTVMLGGCGEPKPVPEAPEKTEKSEGEAPEEDDKPQAEEVALKVWSPEEDQTGDNWLAKECEAFAAAHPEYAITFEYGVCTESDAITVLKTGAKKGADVYMLPNDQIPALLKVGAVMELDKSAADQVRADNEQNIINSVTYQDSMYAVPFTANTWFMYYNKKIFNEADVQSLETMLNKGKVAFQLANGWYIGGFYMGNGCTVFGDDGEDPEAGIDFGGSNAVAVTDYLVDLAANENFINDADGAGIAGMADGSVGAIFSGTWDYQNVVEAIGEENIGVAVPPTFRLSDGTVCQMKAFAGSKAIGVNPHSQYPEAAMQLAAFLGSDEAQKDHYEMRRIIPSNKGIDVSSDQLAKAQSETIARASVLQPLVTEMTHFWGPAQTMGGEIAKGTITHKNSADRTKKMNKAMNSSFPFF